MKSALNSFSSLFPSLTAAALLVTGCGAAPGDGARRVVVERWDTLYVIGSADVDDTTLGSAIGLMPWDDLLVVRDAYEPFVRVFRDGEPVWSFGRAGAGPGEFQSASGLAVAPNGNLWVLDSGLQRLTEISPDGEYVRDISLHHLPTPAEYVVVLHDRVVLATVNPRHLIMELDRESLELLRSIPYALPDTLPRWPRVELKPAPTSDGAGWIAAYGFGPGFYVQTAEDSLRFHRYIDPAWFVSVRPVQGRDSARYAAHAVSTANDEVYMLYGGRPLWLLHEQELPRLIDVYGLDGTYRRSYRLPFDSWRMATDGEVFYVSSVDPFPAIIVLKPR